MVKAYHWLIYGLLLLFLIDLTWWKNSENHYKVIQSQTFFQGIESPSHVVSLLRRSWWLFPSQCLGAGEAPASPLPSAEAVPLVPWAEKWVVRGWELAVLVPCWSRNHSHGRFFVTLVASQTIFSCWGNATTLVLVRIKNKHYLYWQ